MTSPSKREPWGRTLARRWWNEKYREITQGAGFSDGDARAHLYQATRNQVRRRLNPINAKHRLRIALERISSSARRAVRGR